MHRSSLNWEASQNMRKQKDKLFIRVSSAEKNEEMLQNVPHQIRENLAITYHLFISIDDVGMGSTTITNDILKHYGISEEQLHADAMENSPCHQTSSCDGYGKYDRAAYGNGA